MPGRRCLIDPVLFGLLALAFGVRIAVAALTVYHHADEIWQYVEPAYGLVTGDWIRTWDIRSGIRSWLTPLLLLGPVWLGHALSPDSLLHIHLARLTMVLASLGSVWAAWSLGSRVGRRHAIVAAFVAAVWVDFAYFAPRTSSDGLAVSLLFPAIALLDRFRDRLEPRVGVLAGILLGLGFVVRFPLGPAIGVLMVWAARLDLRRGWLPLTIGLMGGIGCDVVGNMIMGQAPLQWIVRNLFANVVQNRSHAFGVEVPQWYLLVLGWQWQYVALPMLLAIWFGARRFPVLLVAALVVIGAHSAISHKEYRFILLGVCLLVFLAAIGSVDIAERLARRRYGEVAGRGAMIGLCGVWLAASALVGLTEPFSINWSVGKAPERALQVAANQQGLCGLATYRIRDIPFVSRAYLNRDVPVLMLSGRAARRRVVEQQGRFNVAIVPVEWAYQLPPAYRIKSCIASAQPLFEQQYCVAVRAGPCSGGAGPYEYNRVLEILDR